MRANSPSRRRPSTGIVLGLLVSMAVIVLVGALAFLQLQRISASIDQLTSQLAEERAVATDIARQVLLAQFYANQFVRTQLQTDVDRFDQEFALLQELLTRADRQIEDPQRREMFDRIQLVVVEYRGVFQEVASLIRQQQRIESEIVRPQGSQVHQKLTALRVHVADLSDPLGFLAVGNAYDEFSQMRLSLARYFAQRDEGETAHFRANYANLKSNLARLDDILQDPAQRQNIADAAAAADAYAAAFEMIRADFIRQHELLRIMIDKLGPEISDVATAMAASVRQEYQQQNEILQRRLWQARLILIFITLVALLAGFLLARVLLRRNAEREQAVEQLRQSEKRYRTLFEGVPIGLYRSEPGGRLVEANPAMIEMLGFPDRESLLATNAIDLYRNAEDRRQWQALLDQHETVRDFEVEFLRRDGQSIWVLNSAKSVRDEQGRVLFYEGSIEDISQRKAADEALRQAQEQLLRREKLAMLGQMAGSISHELRNPLAVMAAAAYYLQIALPDMDEEVAETLEVIINQVNKSNKIISDLLDFARVKAAERQAVAVMDLVDQALASCLPPSNVAVEVELSDDLPDLYVDPQQIEQVLVNLITNAYQAMPEGGRLSIKATANEQHVAIAASDTGVGISPENMEKLFEPLFTTKASGVGLGLALCQNLVQLNGGHIQVESAEGRGSTFIIRLPLAG